MHPLDVILQLQLGSDQAAVLSLPSIICSITSSHFEASPHLQKWISRVTSLIHSKHPGARWAGLCLALQTSILSKDLMMESAQNWVAITLPMLSRNETPPTWKACIRLLDHIFSSAIAMPEFQRQLATPNVPKFSAALIALAEKSDDGEIRHISFTTLIHLIPLYPTLHRALHPSLSSLSLRPLSGSSTTPTPSDIIEDACNLHAVLHFTGGKVGAAPLWRKSLDTALANAYSAFVALRTTFPQLPRSTIHVQPTLADIPTDPVVAIPLSMDRLRCSISLINTLLQAVTVRPVPVPVGELVKLALRFLRCTSDEVGESHFDATRRALEISVIPEIWKLSCELVSQMAKSIRHHLDPHLPRIVSHITHHLEQSIPKSHRVPFLHVLPPLLSHTHALHTSIPPTRLVKTLLPALTALLSSKSEVQQQQLQNASTTASTSKKGKKRARGYEGDEVFKVGRGVLCPTHEDGAVVEATLEALDPLLSNPHLSDTVRVLAARLLVTILLELPRHPQAALSPDLSLHGRIHARVLTLCNKHVLGGASGWVNSAVGLIVNAVSGTIEGSDTVIHSAVNAQRELDVLLHPRLPPLMRSLPPVEAVSLFRTGSTKEDKATRDALGVEGMEDVQAAGGSLTTTTMMTASSVTTIAQADPGPSVPPAQQQSWGMAAPPASAVSASTSTFTLTPSTPPPTAAIATQNSGLPFLSTSIASSIALPKATAPAQPVQDNADASTSGEVYTATHYHESDEEDEEMPDIDTRSDSD